MSKPLPGHWTTASPVRLPQPDEDLVAALLLDLDEFIAQSEEYREGGDLLDSVYKVLNVIGATHPFSVVRVAELRDWIDSGAYDNPDMAEEVARRLLISGDL